jgi:hypothetical protein
MLFLACRQQRPTVGVVERHVRRFRNIDLSDLLDVTSGLYWNAVRFILDLDGTVEYLYGLLSELIDVFAPMRQGGNWIGWIAMLSRLLQSGIMHMKFGVVM